MFFPLEAVADHPCCKMQEVVQSFLSKSISEPAFSIEFFPEFFRNTLNDSRSTLEADFREVHGLLHRPDVTQSIRDALLEEFRTSNLIAELCDRTAQIARATIDWTKPLGVALAALMGKLYDSLDLVVFRRQDQGDQPTHQMYREFIKKNKYVCPFCGLRRFKNVRGTRREDFDHYLNKSRFPFAAANTANLVPTCGICNQDYKKQKNILSDGKAFYPYGLVPQIELKIECTRLPSTGDLDDKGDWSVALTPNVDDTVVNEKIITWDRVYKISDRLVEDIQEYGDEWMTELRNGDPPQEIDDDQFRNLIQQARIRAEESSTRRMEERQIVRAAFYEFMLNRADPIYRESFRRLLARLPA